MCGRKKLPFAEYSVVKYHVLSASGRRAGFATSGSVGPLNPTPPLAASPHLVVRAGQTTHWSNDRAERGFQGSPQGWARVNCTPYKKLENTGLEPVTSWLQTRRSPS